MDTAELDTDLDIGLDTGLDIGLDIAELDTADLDIDLGIADLDTVELDTVDLGTKTYSSSRNRRIFIIRQNFLMK